MEVKKAYWVITGTEKSKAFSDLLQRVSLKKANSVTYNRKETLYTTYFWFNKI